MFGRSLPSPTTPAAEPWANPGGIAGPSVEPITHAVPAAEEDQLSVLAVALLVLGLMLTVIWVAVLVLLGGRLVIGLF